MGFYSNSFFSCISIVIGYIIHAIVLKAQGKPISDFFATRESEDELLCTCLFAFLFTMFFRVYNGLRGLLSKFIPSIREKDNSTYMEEALLKMLHLKDVCMQLYNNSYKFIMLYKSRFFLNSDTLEYLDRSIDDIKRL